MNKLRIGSIMKFDSTKSRKEAYNCGRKKGALEEQKKELVFLNKLQERLNSYYCGYHKQLNKMIDNRKKELREVKK
jgi:hypothetical protein